MWRSFSASVPLPTDFPSYYVGSHGPLGKACTFTTEAGRTTFSVSYLFIYLIIIPPIVNSGDSVSKSCPSNVFWCFRTRLLEDPQSAKVVILDPPFVDGLMQLAAQYG